MEHFHCQTASMGHPNNQLHNIQQQYRSNHIKSNIHCWHMERISCTCHRLQQARQWPTSCFEPPTHPPPTSYHWTAMAFHRKHNRQLSTAFSICQQPCQQSSRRQTRISRYHHPYSRRTCPSLSPRSTPWDLSPQRTYHSQSYQCEQKTARKSYRCFTSAIHNCQSHCQASRRCHRQSNQSPQRHRAGESKLKQLPTELTSV